MSELGESRFGYDILSVSMGSDYETTIATEPLWTDAKTGIGYPDNGNLGFEIGDGIAPPGTYLWILEGVNSTPGFWTETNALISDDSDVVFFHKGKRPSLTDCGTVFL